MMGDNDVVVSVGKGEIELRWSYDGVFVHLVQRSDQPAFLDIAAASTLHRELGEWLLERARSDERWRDAIGSTMAAMFGMVPLVFHLVGGQTPSKESVSGARATIMSFGRALIRAGEGARLRRLLWTLIREEGADFETKTLPPTEDVERFRQIVDLEEELGPIVPGGAQGGVVAKHRREATWTCPACTETLDGVEPCPVGAKRGAAPIPEGECCPGCGAQRVALSRPGRCTKCNVFTVWAFICNGVGSWYVCVDCAHRCMTAP
jgi:hypothetical protein